MEGFAALGVAVNIAQVLEYGYKLVQKSRNLREVGSVDPDLDGEARRMQALAASLDSQVIPKDHENLRLLAHQSVEVSTKLVEELDSLKLTDPKSKRQRAVAIWRSERRKKHIRELENRLRNCEAQLGLYLTNLSRTESIVRLDGIRLDLGKITSELADLQSTAKTLTDVSQGVSSSIQVLAKTYHGQLGEQLILDRLHFPDMHERFDIIPQAHEETFKWLFNSDNNGTSTKIQASKDFISWLQQGSGFFHISGKVGAGKSTMMKYICSHGDLDAHLGVWCEGAQLGRGQFFFWRPGTVAQKSLKGLLRGLLHSILARNPDLISTALPAFWKLVITHPTSSREMEYRDFEEGFSNILKHASNSRQYKFALFIDGLDEFEGEPLSLIKTMKGWTEKYPSILKICVSSRDYSVFQVSFSPYPKLRLHEYTSTDIARMVSTQLQSILQHTDSLMSDQALQMLTEIIRERAEGVFLWVSLVLANVEDAMMSGASLYELKTRIEAYPTELEPLYWHLVHLIHETDREWAFRALKMVQFSQSHQDTIEDPRFWGLSLLELSFLEDTRHSGKFESRTINEQLNNTYRKVYGRCKGFLHVRDRDGIIGFVTVTAPMKQEVLLIHRSIVEFLETSNFLQLAAPYIAGFDCFDNACGALARCTEHYRSFLNLTGDEMSLDGEDYSLDASKPWNFVRYRLMNYISLAMHIQRSASSNFMSFLDDLQGTFLTHAKESGHPLEYTTQFFALIRLVIGSSKFLKQIQEEQPQQTTLLPQRHEFFDLFFRYGYRDSWAHVTQDQFITVMAGALYLGINLHHVWKTVIHGLMTNTFPSNWCAGVIIDWCLRQGADGNRAIGSLIRDGPYSFSSVSPNDGWVSHNTCLEPLSQWEILHFKPSFSSTRWSSNFHLCEMLLLMNETSDLNRCIKENGGVLRFRDLLGFWYPNNQYFRSLIDGLDSISRGREDSYSQALPDAAGIPLGAIHGQQCEKEYREYFGRDVVEEILEGAGMTYDRPEDVYIIQTRGTPFNVTVSMGFYHTSTS